MDKLRFFMLFLLCPWLIYGQEFKLKSMHEVYIDSIESIYSKTDLNGKPSAIMVLAFSNPIKGIILKGNIIHQVQVNDTIMIANVADGTKKVTIQHEEFYPYVINFKDNGIHIKGGHTYQVMIDSKQDENLSGDTQYLIFKTDEKINLLKVNGIAWDLESTHGWTGYQKLVTLGTYKYEARNDGGDIVRGQVEVRSKNFSTVVRLSFNK